MGGVGGDALGGVRHEGVGQTLGEHSVNEIGGLEHSGVHHHRHGLDIPHLGDKAADVLVLHLRGDEGVVQHAAIDGHGGMQGVEAGAHLHLLHLVHRLPVGVKHPALFQRGTAVGILVLNDQILGLLRVDEGGGISMLLGDNGVIVLESVGLEHILYLGVGPGGDLVDHAPGEGHLGLILEVVQESLGHQAGLHPCLGIGHNSALHLIPVVGAVIHALHGDRQLARLIALIEQGGDLAHDQLGLRPPLQVGGRDGVALLGDGEAHHLQGGVLEDLLQPLPVLVELGISLQALGDRGHHPLLNGAVGLEQHGQAQIVIGLVGLVNDLIVKALGHDDAPVVLPRVQHPLKQGGREGPEDVAGPEVNPGGLVVGLGPDGLQVEFGQFIALVRPLLGVEGTSFNIRKLHFRYPSLL